MDVCSSSSPDITTYNPSILTSSKLTRPEVARINSGSTSPSPTSSSSSFSFFDSPHLHLELDPRFSAYRDAGSDRRQSAESTTSWGSMGMIEPNKPPDDGEQDMETDQPFPAIGAPPIPPPMTQHSASSETISSTSSAEHTLTTPDLSQSNQFPTFIDSFAHHNTSPSSSTTSTAPSKGENTPRAELPPPVWPLSTTSPRNHDFYVEPDFMPNAAVQQVHPLPTTSRDQSLKRDGSWRRKHASLDTPATAPHLDPAFPSFSNLRHTPPFLESVPRNGDCSNVKQTASWPNPSHPDVGRSSGESDRLDPSGTGLVAESPATGCFISAPIQPPAGYPLPALATSLRRDSAHSGPEQSPRSSSASTKSSSSRKSKSKSPHPPPPPPKWAQPPAKTNSISGRALSFGSSQDRPDVDFDDFEPELLEGDKDEWIEVMKGAEGRIAIKSTPAVYDIMVWLPGFSLDNITIATRGHRTIHIVADQWDEGDHAQWDIKLGEDANLKSVNAKFTGKELRVIVAREQRPPLRSSASYRSASTASSSRSGAGSYSTPSITATTGHNSLDQAPAPSNGTLSHSRN